MLAVFTGHHDDPSFSNVRFFFSIPFWLMIINPRVEAEFVEGSKGLGSQNISKPI